MATHAEPQMAGDLTANSLDQLENTLYNKLQQELGWDKVIKTRDDSVLPKAKVYVHKQDEFEKFIGQFMENPDIRDYDSFVIASEYVDAGLLGEVRLEVEWQPSPSNRGQYNDYGGGQ